MSHKLQKPYTEKQRIAFIVEYNHKKGLTIEETSEALFALDVDEVLQNGIPVKDEGYEAQKLLELKKLKHSENLKKAFEAEENGKVEYKNAVFETSPSNISKLTSQFAMIQAGIISSVQWLSKDDKQVMLFAEDIMCLGQLMSEYASQIWNTQYLDYKEQIENALNINALNNIILSY